MALKKGKAGKKPGDKGGGGKPRKGKPSPGNTASFPYLDSKAVAKKCGPEKKAIEDNCKPESEDTKAARQKGKGGLLSKLKLPRASGGGKPGTEWIGDHCDFLMVKPGSASEMFKELQGLPDQIAQQMGTKALEAVENRATEALEEAVKKKLLKLGLKQLVVRVGSFLGGPWVGVPVNIAMTADGANDIAKAVSEFPDLKAEMDKAKQALGEARKAVEEAKSLFDHYKKPDGSLNQDALVSDTMEGAARLNPCISARRCQLVPFNQTENPAALNGKGCCPGQTGHHLLPEAMFKHCANYGAVQHSNAPTMCVEGATNAHGSHGKAHSALLEVLKRDHPNIPFGQPLPKKDAIDAGVKSAQIVFPLAGCSENCLKAQLEDHYKKLNCRPNKESGVSGNSRGDHGEY